LEKEEHVLEALRVTVYNVIRVANELNICLDKNPLPYLDIEMWIHSLRGHTNYLNKVLFSWKKLLRDERLVK